MGVVLPFNMLMAWRSCEELVAEARGVDTEERLFPAADTLRVRPLGLLTLLRFPPSFEGDSASWPAPAPPPGAGP